MFRSVLALAVVVFVSLTGPSAALAQEPSASRLAASDRLMRALEIEKQVNTMVSAMSPALAGGAQSGLSPEFRQVIDEVTQEVIFGVLTPRMLARFRVIYATVFTEDEMIAVAEFYEGPAGRAMLAKTPQLAAESAKVAAEIFPDVQKETLRRICERVDCTGKEAPRRARPS